MLFYGTLTLQIWTIFTCLFRDENNCSGLMIDDVPATGVPPTKLANMLWPNIEFLLPETGTENYDVFGLVKQYPPPFFN